MQFDEKKPIILYLDHSMVESKTEPKIEENSSVHAYPLEFSISVFQHTQDAFFLLNEDLKYIDVNPQFEKITGLNKYDVIGSLIFSMCLDNHEDLYLNLIEELKTYGELRQSLLLTLKNGYQIHIGISINQLKLSTGNHYLGNITDLRTARSTEKRAHFLEAHDPLTHLYNRIGYNHRLKDYLDEDPHPDRQLAIMRINIDRFRYLNHMLQNGGGDELLKQIGQRLEQATNDAYLVARLNADDFAVLLERQDTDLLNSEINIEYDYQRYAQRILNLFQQPFIVRDIELNITASIGIALYPEHSTQADMLNTHAEHALLAAKKLGGNTIVTSKSTRQSKIVNRLYLERDLRQAVVEDQFVVYYQPKIDSKTQKIIGFEALIRWQHPEHGLVLPSQFIRIAEETGLIIQIGTLVIHKVAKQLHDWQQMQLGEFSVSINVVAQQILRGTLVEEFDQILEKYQVDPHNIEIEITESSLMDNSDKVNEVLKQLHQRGIRIALDDFGVGYSSLAYLGLYTFDTIKIDQFFIAGIGKPKQEAIVKAIIAMAKAMDKQTVAEGVEMQSQYDFLTAEHCDILQGYLIGKPVCSDNTTALLKQHRQQSLV